MTERSEVVNRHSDHGQVDAERGEVAA